MGKLFIPKTTYYILYSSTYIYVSFFNYHAFYSCSYNFQSFFEGFSENRLFKSTKGLSR